jgi:hypothetical protein
MFGSLLSLSVSAAQIIKVIIYPRDEEEAPRSICKCVSRRNHTSTDLTRCAIRQGPGNYGYYHQPALL